MYDFEIDSIQEMVEVWPFIRDMSLKRERDIIYFAILHWDLKGIYRALDCIQHRPCWHWDNVRSTILTWWFYHGEEAENIKLALKKSACDQPVVVGRILNLERAKVTLERRVL